MQPDPKSAFYTRPASNAGIRLPLYDPLTGEETAHWLHVQGADSDAFQHGNLEAQRTIVREVGARPKITDAERAEVSAEARLRLLATVISAWSFGDNPSLEERIAFLRDAPQVAEALDRAISNRRLFLHGNSSSSETSPAPSSS